MGKRERRRRRQSGQTPGAGSPGRDGAPHRPAGPSPTSRPRGALDVEGALTLAAQAWQRGDGAAVASLVRCLAEHWQVDPRRVPAAVDSALGCAVAQTWVHGWQPADLHRVLARRLGARGARLGGYVIAAQARSYHSSPGADPRWLRQLDDLGAGAWWPPATASLDAWRHREGASQAEVLSGAVEVLGCVWTLPVLPVLTPPPHQWGATASRSGGSRAGAPGATASRAARADSGVDAKVLDRVRALLAKAESTEFAAEAETYTAKAQQLMSRHAIDHAMLAPETAGEPEGRRLGIDDPYAGAKATLLHQVAGASRCRAVWSSELGFATVFAFEAELDGVELLYTSLLVQATSALLAAGHGERRGRTTAFRRSFLTSFALRIGERLHHSAEETVAEATTTHGSALLPVLAARSQAVDDAVGEMFPQLRRRSVSISDRAGWAAGRVAADLASLARGAAVEASRSA